MKTAVDWLIEQLTPSISLQQKHIDDLKAKAKEMEKEQIIDAYETAEKDCGKDFLHGDLYYNEIFKSE